MKIVDVVLNYETPQIKVIQIEFEGVLAQSNPTGEIDPWN